MAVPLTERAMQRLALVRAMRNADDSWRRPGCGPRCQAVLASLPGRAYPERLPQHDPEHHEAYGKNVLAARLPTVLGGSVQTGPLVIDGLTCTARVHGRSIRLTAREIAILAVLAARIGSVVPYHELLRAVWGPEYVLEHQRGTGLYLRREIHILRTNVSRIRAKLGPARALIQTVPALGYCLQDVPAEEEETPS